MDMTRRVMLGASTATIAILASGCARTAGSGDTAFNEVLNRGVTDFLREAPEFCTSLAVSEEQAGGRFMDRLSDASKDGRHRNLQLSERVLNDVKAIHRDSLTDASKVTYDVVVSALEDGNAASRYDCGGGATAPYELTQLTGAYTGLPDFLASQHQVTNRETADAYLSRLSAYKTVLDQEIAVFNTDVGAGVIAPNFALSGAIGQLRTFTNKAPAANVLVDSFK